MFCSTGPFLVQFLILSALFGIPLFLFHVALGHYLGAGVMDMWRISPVFQVNISGSLGKIAGGMDENSAKNDRKSFPNRKR